eukprot:TRINITY_DN1274_c0_g1_i14.p1 TRINITY_DN1274_c0_g1~~TRINITY_DN1274_c0_g1_i14.p1  ORF type:complete len:147 (+),score=18.10 TRINITY_DN1274_c0_g1_i14:61-501(+)
MSKCRGCHFTVTGVSPTHCCHGCERRPGNHGPMCKQVIHRPHHHHHHHHHGHHHHHAHVHVHRTPAMPMLTGVWMADQGASNQTSIAQAGGNITCTNPGQPWSPATGVVHANRTITFQTGLVGITGTFDGMNKIVFSNGCSWTKTA